MISDVSEFMQCLDRISDHEGEPYGRAHLLFDEETKHREAMLQFKGYLALSDTSKCFFLETVEGLNVECRPRTIAPLSGDYLRFLPRIAHAFKTLCASERVAIQGYPFQGYTLLRNAFDSLVLTSAALQKLTDFDRLDGVEPGQPFERARARKLRKETEYAVRRRMTGDQSGLSPDTLEQLAILDRLFDDETHGGRLSLTEAMPWMTKSGPLRVLPTFNTDAAAMFINRYGEVSWMLHRLLPAVQPPDASLPDRWRQNWRALDECFRYYEDGLTRELGKKVGAAVIEFVNAKFPFSERAFFPL